MSYERKGGQFSEGDTFMKIIDLMQQLEQQYYIMGHYKKENGDEVNGQGWLAMGEMTRNNRIFVTQLATGKIRKSAGFR